jgi:hypothetical protein
VSVTHPFPSFLEGYYKIKITPFHLLISLLSLIITHYHSLSFIISDGIITHYHLSKKNEKQKLKKMFVSHFGIMGIMGDNTDVNPKR